MALDRLWRRAARYELRSRVHVAKLDSSGVPALAVTRRFSGSAASILSLCTLRSITGSFQIAMQSVENVISLAIQLFAGQHGSFDRCRLNHAQEPLC